MLKPIKQTLRKDGWVRPYFARYWRLLILAVVLSLIAYIFAAGLMFTSGYMISLAATLPFTVLALHVPSLFVRIFGIGKPILQYAERLSSHDWVLRMTSGMRERLYIVLESHAVKSFGKALGLFSADIEHLQNLALRTILPWITCLLLYACVVVAMGVFSPALGLLMLVMMGIVVVVLPLVSIAVNSAHVAKVRSLETEMFDVLADDVLAATDWKLSGRKGEFIGRTAELYERAFQAEAKVRRYQRTMAVAKQFVFAAVACMLLVWCSYAFAKNGNLLAGSFLSSSATDWLRGVFMHDSVPNAANWIAAFVLCVFPLLDVLFQADDSALGFAEHSDALQDLDDLESDKSADSELHVPESLEGLSLSVSKGEHVAIIGKSGVGKTSLIKILMASSRPDIAALPLDSKVGLVEQSPYVFRKSLRENLLVSKPSATDDELVRVLEYVGLKKKLDSLPEGLDTLIAEGGASLSGGEAQRLAIARIFLYECDTVLLDEPYIGLDVQTQAELSEVLFKVFDEKTIVMVTHDLIDIGKFDRIVHLKDGEPARMGSPEELAGCDSEYAKLSQFSKRQKDGLHNAKLVYNN